MVDRVHRELTKEEIQNIARTHHAWQGEHNAGQHREIPGFCKSPTLKEVRKHGQVRTPAGISVPKSATMIISPLGRRRRGSREATPKTAGGGSKSWMRPSKPGCACRGSQCNVDSMPNGFL
jgi:hypothetical protein